jgi:RNA polymerase sigma-70 factor, ECF subfamily
LAFGGPIRYDQNPRSGSCIRNAKVQRNGTIGGLNSVVYLTRQLFTHVRYADNQLKSREAAFELEALPWIDDVHRFALSLTRDESEADDVVQDTFLRAYRSWHTYMPGSDCRRWLFTICRNVFLRARERARPTVELEASEVDSAIAGSLYDMNGREALEDVVSRLDLAPAIAEALAKVPEPFRSTLVIVDVGDQSYESAAEEMGVPIGTVRSRLFRGRRLMQEQLSKYAIDAGFGQRRALSA